MQLSAGLPSSPVIWGVFTRALGLVYLIAFASLHRQVLGIAGSRGITPIAPLLRKIRDDYPSAARFLYFPTLLWISAGDRALRLLPLLGCGAALLVLIGGPASPVALFACWACYLSLDLAVDFERPWDTLLLESGFLALFLPRLCVLPEVAAVGPPMATISWAYRWLFFRLMFGFGKQKFARSSFRDLDYLWSFFINQPMPTPLGYHAHRLPLWILKPALVATFVIEVVLPFLVFFTGWPRLLVAALTAGLMLVIQLVGNYSFFNLLVVALCVTLLDVDASLLRAPLPWQATGAERCASAVALVLALGGLLCLPFNHWCTRTFLSWPALREARFRPLRWLLAFYRGLLPFHVVHAYGVFPPRSGPPVRIIPLIEGTRDGQTWEEYRYRFQPCTASSAPRFIAPYQPWLDYTFIYEGMGHNLSGLLCSISGTGNPYRFSRYGALDRLLERLMEGSPEVSQLFAQAPFSASSPPLAIRARLCMLIPTTPAERARTGAWWARRAVGMHAPPTPRRADLWDSWLPEPELFHLDDILWKRRAAALRELFRSAGDDPLPPLTCASGVTEDDLAMFWDEFLPLVGPPDLARLPEAVERLRRRFEGPVLRRLERAMGRLSLLLTARLDPHRQGLREPRLPLVSFFHLGLFAHHVIGQGRGAYEAALREPGRAAAMLPEFTAASGLYYLGLFRPETLRYHAQKLRLAARSWGEKLLDSPLRGAPDLYPILYQVLEEDQERAMPQLRKVASGRWEIMAPEHDRTLTWVEPDRPHGSRPQRT